MDEWMDGWMDGDGWLGGWMDGYCITKYLILNHSVGNSVLGNLLLKIYIPWTGRPKPTSIRKDRKLLKHVRRAPFTSAPVLRNQQPTLHPDD